MEYKSYNTVEITKQFNIIKFKISVKDCDKIL